MSSGLTRLQEADRLLDFGYVDDTILPLKQKMSLSVSLITMSPGSTGRDIAYIISTPYPCPSERLSQATSPTSSFSIDAPPPTKRRRLSLSSVSDADEDDDEDKPLAARMTRGPDVPARTT